MPRVTRQSTPRAIRSHIRNVEALKRRRLSRQQRRRRSQPQQPPQQHDDDDLAGGGDAADPPPPPPTFAEWIASKKIEINPPKNPRQLLTALFGDPSPPAPLPDIEFPKPPSHYFEFNEDVNNECGKELMCGADQQLALQWDTRIMNPTVCCVSQDEAFFLAGGDPKKVFDREHQLLTTLHSDMYDRIVVLRNVWKAHAQSIGRSGNVPRLRRLFDRIVAVYTMTEELVAFLNTVVEEEDRFDVAVLSGATGISTRLTSPRPPVYADAYEGDKFYLRHWIKYAFMVTIKAWYTAMCQTVPRFDLTKACRALSQGSYTIIGSALTQNHLTPWGMAMLAAFATHRVLTEYGIDISYVLQTSLLTFSTPTEMHAVLAVLVAAFLRFVTYMGHNSGTIVGSITFISFIVQGIAFMTENEAKVSEAASIGTVRVLYKFLKQYVLEPNVQWFLETMSSIGTFVDVDEQVAETRRKANEVGGTGLLIGTAALLGVMPTLRHMVPHMSEWRVYSLTSAVAMNYMFIASAYAYVQSADYLIQGVAVKSFTAQALDFIQHKTIGSYRDLAHRAISSVMDLDETQQHMYETLLVMMMVFYTIVHMLYTSTNIDDAAEIAAETVPYDLASNAVAFFEQNGWAALPRIDMDVGDLNCDEVERDQHCAKVMATRDDLFATAKFTRSIISDS